MSCLARLSTFESIVSTDNALAFTINGALRNAASKELYLMLISVRYCGIGKRLSLASQIKAREPSEPVRKRLSCGKSLIMAARFSWQRCAIS